MTRRGTTSNVVGLPSMARHPAGVTLLRISGDPWHALSLVLPALNRPPYRDDHAAPGWTVWLAPPFALDRHALRRIGLDLRHSRVVRQSAQQRYGLPLIESALRSPANAIVLAWPRHWDSQHLPRLQRAADAGRSVGFVFLPDESPVRATPDLGPTQGIGPSQPVRPLGVDQQMSFGVGDRAPALPPPG